MPLRAIITQGTAADCKQAVALIDGFSAQHLLADRGYDTNDILCQTANLGMMPVIPPKNIRALRNPISRKTFEPTTIADAHITFPTETIQIFRDSIYGIV
jgi:Transposase DDE domain.